MRKVNFLLLAALAVTTVFTGCKKDDDEVEVVETKPAIRTKVEYSSLTATTPYINEFFVDEAGDSTVDRVTGMNRFQSFKGLNAMGASGTITVLDASVLKNMYANKGNAFGGSYAFLNTSGVQLRNVTASSLSSTEAEVVRKKIESFLDSLAKASTSNAETAENGKAGIIMNDAKTGKYLVDGKGIEWNQIVQKGLIGAFQIDYIGNVLLNKGLSADNYSLVLGRNYTQLEHNWDEAFGVLTLNKVYGVGGNATTKPTSESFIGSYVWEYNKSGFEKMHLAFLKGRAAIINNDMATVRAQSDLIRKEMEYAIANAAVGYMKKWKDAGVDNGAAAHALGEGAGFIYALRFCKMHNADAAFSDDLFNKIITSGHWNLTPTVVDSISTAIKAKFNIQ